MTETQTRSDHGEVPYDSMKIKHIESMTEATVTITADTDGSLTPYDLRDLAHETIRGPIKTRRELTTAATDGTSVTLRISGYTCTQWHHSATELSTGLKQSIESRLTDTQLADGTIDISLGAEHDVNAMRGSELLNQLAAPQL